MKNLTGILLAAILILSGCTAPATETAAPVADASSAVESAVSDASPAVSDDAAAMSTAEVPSSLPEMPAPDTTPVPAIGAVTLPEVLGTSTAGYAIEAITPAQYDLQLEMQRGGYRGFPNADVFYLGQGGKYAVANAKGKLITDFEYDQNNDWNSAHGLIYPTKGQSNAVLSATDGKALFPAAHGSIAMVFESDKLLLHRDGDAYRVTDLAGKTIFKLARGDGIYVRGGDTIMITQDGMLKLYRLSDYAPIDNFVCEETQLIAGLGASHDEVRIAFSVDGQWGMCDLDGKFLVNPMYEEIGYMEGDYAEFTQNGKKGVLRRDGKVVVKPEWEDLIADGKSVRVLENGKWGAITDIDSGKVNIPPMYDELLPFDANGTASFLRGDKYGMLDREGNEAVSAKYDGRLFSGANMNLDPGYFLVEGEAPFEAGIVGGGKMIFSADYSFSPQGINHEYVAKEEPYNLIMTPRGQWGYIDRKGKLVIDTKFDAADGFVKGHDFAVVKQNGKISLIDRKGNSLLDTVFSDVVAFNPETLVFAMQYTASDGTVKGCLAKVTEGANAAQAAGKK